MTMLEYVKANWTVIYRSFMSLCMGALATWVIAYGINLASTADQRMFTTPEIRMEVEKNHELYPTPEQLRQVQEILNSPALKTLTDTTYLTKEEFEVYTQAQNNQLFDMLNRFLRHEQQANGFMREMRADQKLTLEILDEIRKNNK